MTGDALGNRALPSLPNPDHLRKQAKARLTAMRTRLPGTRLAEAQFVLAREYGFASWVALQAEVTKRTSGPLGAWAKIRRAPVAPLHPERYRLSDPDGDAADGEVHMPFFHAAGAVQIGFVFAALTGVSLLFLSGRPHDAMHLALERVGHPLMQMTHIVLPEKHHD